MQLVTKYYYFLTEGNRIRSPLYCRKEDVKRAHIRYQAMYHNKLKMAACQQEHLNHTIHTLGLKWDKLPDKTKRVPNEDGNVPVGAEMQDYVNAAMPSVPNFSESPVTSPKRSHDGRYQAFTPGGKWSDEIRQALAKRSSNFRQYMYDSGAYERLIELVKEFKVKIRASIFINDFLNTAEEELKKKRPSWWKRFKKDLKESFMLPPPE